MCGWNTPPEGHQEGMSQSRLGVGLFSALRPSESFRHFFEVLSVGDFALSLKSFRTCSPLPSV